MISKSGGKTDLKFDVSNLKAAVVVCSDTVSKGEKEDTSGKKIIESLQQYNIQTSDYTIVPDDVGYNSINWLKNMVAENFDMIIFTGGTGLSERDKHLMQLSPLIEKEIPGITWNKRRNYGQQRMPYAMFSRGVAGFIKDTLVLTTPGSENGAADTIDAIFPFAFHALDVKKNRKH